MHEQFSDNHFPITEQFPRRMAFEIRDELIHGEPMASFFLHMAEPNAFPEGPIAIGDKLQGFQIGAQLGDTLSDKSYISPMAIGFMMCCTLPMRRYLAGLRRYAGYCVSDGVVIISLIP